VELHLSTWKEIENAGSIHVGVVNRTGVNNCGKTNAQATLRVTKLVLRKIERERLVLRTLSADLPSEVIDC
jgi:hypothetical protein